MFVQQIAKEFTLEFVANPYLCYTEHGQHALFYTMLFNALPAEQRFTVWGTNKVCVIQKEYPTAGKLGKPQRQHWDIAVIKTPPSSMIDGESLSYDYLRLAAVVEFGMNEARKHLIDDIERICHEQANLDHGIIIHLYRLSRPGARISGRDWSSNSPRILSKEEVLNLIIGKPVDVYYGLHDSTGIHETGAVVQDRVGMNLYSGRGVAVRELPLETSYADYLLFVVIGGAGSGAGNIRQLEAGGAIEAGDFEAGV